MVLRGIQRRHRLKIYRRAPMHASIRVFRRQIVQRRAGPIRAEFPRWHPEQILSHRIVENRSQTKVAAMNRYRICSQPTLAGRINPSFLAEQQASKMHNRYSNLQRFIPNNPNPIQLQQFILRKVHSRSSNLYIIPILVLINYVILVLKLIEVCRDNPRTLNIRHFDIKVFHFSS